MRNFFSSAMRADFNAKTPRRKVQVVARWMEISQLPWQPLLLWLGRNCLFPFPCRAFPCLLAVSRSTGKAGQCSAREEKASAANPSRVQRAKVCAGHCRWPPAAARRETELLSLSILAARLPPPSRFPRANSW